MRYFYEEGPGDGQTHGSMFIANHPMFRRATLYFEDGIGLLVVQQYYNPITRKCWWDMVEQRLADDIFLHENFKEFFKKHAKPIKNGRFPIVQVRKMMWEMRMKPMQKEAWESWFS